MSLMGRCSCRSANDLRWARRCVLKAGAVVVVGPGQSVSTGTCCGALTGDAKSACEASGEHYAANDIDWQVYIGSSHTRASNDPTKPADLMACVDAPIVDTLDTVTFASAP